MGERGREESGEVDETGWFGNAKVQVTDRREMNMASLLHVGMPRRAARLRVSLHA